MSLKHYVSKTDLGLWRLCRTEGNYSEHSRGEDGTCTVFLCSLFPLLLLGDRMLRKFWLGNDLDLVLWSWPGADKSDGEKRLKSEVKSSLACWVSHHVRASFPGCGGQAVDPVTE